VDTDRPLKVLFERQGQSLLPFIGESDSRARVTAVQPVELPVPSRTADCVLRLEAEGLVWYRHVEFVSGPDPDMPRRCFEYASRLVLHCDAPVLTTVLYLLPGADRGAADAFRVTLGERVVNLWRFEIVRLWELDVSLALSSGEPGPLALVPLLGGGDEPANVRQAVRMLGAMPRAAAGDAISVLMDLAGQRYDRATFMNVLGKDRAMQSWLWQMGADEGRAEGQITGRVLAARQICADLARELHPRVAGRALPAIGACEDPEALRAWILQCPKLSDAEFLALVRGKPPARAGRSRASRPSRGARPSKRR